MGDVEPLNGLAQLTVCSWVNLTSQGSSGLIKKSDYGWLLYKSFSDDSMSFYVDDDGEEPWASYISGTTKVNDSRWHHVCGVYGNSTLKLYVDGKSEGTIEGTPPDKLLSNSDPLIIGKWKNSTANASIDEIKIWNYALAKEEINNEYHQVRDKLVSYWNFDGNAQDSTGENHGTINGATLTEGISGQAYKFDGISQ